MDPIEKIYKKYYKDVYRFVLALSHDQYVSEDIAQETFLKAMNAIDKFKGDCDIRVWLCQIAKNTFFTYNKKNQKLVLVPDDTLIDKPSERDFVTDILDDEQAAQIQKILDELHEPYKEVFSLRIFGLLSFGQIAKLYGKTESWARVTFHRARLMIITQLEKN